MLISSLKSRLSLPFEALISHTYFRQYGLLSITCPSAPKDKSKYNLYNEYRGMIDSSYRGLMAPKTSNSRVIVPRQNTLSTKLTLPWLVPIKNSHEERSLVEKTKSTSDIRTVCQLITHQEKLGKWKNNRQQRSVFSSEVSTPGPGIKEMRSKGLMPVVNSSLPKITACKIQGNPISRNVQFTISEKTYLELPRLKPGVREAILKCLNSKSPRPQFKRRIESKKGLKDDARNHASESQLEFSANFQMLNLA